MIDQDFLKTLSSKLAAVVPAAAQARDKLEQDLFQLLQRNLAHLNLVGQEEFKAQVQLLEQAQRRIDELERKIEALEQSRSS